MIEVYIDGASAGNPGPSGAGIFIKNGSVQPEHYSVALGHLSNHEAEFHAFIQALQICLKNEYRVISVRTDSQLVDQAIERRYVKNQKYRELLEHALSLTEKFDLFFLKWIPGSKNKNADELARKAIQLNK